jgi:3-methylfumaryl-CoA hydratase
MWAASEVSFLAPIPDDAAIERTSTITTIEEKQGRTGRLVFVTVDHETCAAGQKVVAERQSLVFREAAAGPAVATAEPSRVDAPPTFHRQVRPSEPLLFRYSALTYNAHRIHYDAPYATGVEGYPGLVVQGPLIATLLLDLCAREFGADALVRFNFRARAPAFCGEALELVGWIEGDRVRLEARVNGRIAASAEGRLRHPRGHRPLAASAPLSA